MDEEEDRKTDEGPRPEDYKAGELPTAPPEPPAPDDSLDLAEEADAISDELETAAEEAEPTTEPDEQTETSLSSEGLEGPESDGELEATEDPEQEAPEGLQEDDSGVHADEATAIAGELETAAEAASPAPTAKQKRTSRSGLTPSQFGSTLEQFNAAGGAGAGVTSFGETEGEDGGLTQFAGSVVHHASKQDEMLIEHARMLDDMTRRLELERL